MEHKRSIPDYYIREINTVDGTKALIQVWDIFEAFHLTVPRAFAAKYILRAGYKDPKKEIDDIQKAINCLIREQEEIERRMEKEKKAAEHECIHAYVPKQGSGSK